MEELKRLALEIVPAEYHEKFLYSFDGGKRIRPLLMKGVCENLGKDFFPLQKAALGVEMLHCSTLLHDDVIDGDTVRRGEITFYKKFSVKQAVLYGDLFALLSMDIFKKEYPSLLGQVLDSVMSVLEGQMMEFSGIKSLEEYIEYAEKKTSSMFILAARIPCLFFGSDESVPAGFAREFGIAFQIANDLKKRGERNSILSFLDRKEAESLLEKKTRELEASGISVPEILSVLKL